MGTLSASPTVLSRIEGSNGKCITFSLVGSSSYATGGDTWDLSSFFAVVDNIVGGSDGGVHAAGFDRASAGAPSTSKVLFYNSGAADGGDETANATDMSAITLLLTVFGR